MLKVVGSGLGRTGTKSLQLALNTLGYGPCHHMEEVLARPATMPLWIEAGAGRPDWNAIFDGYLSMVDYPGAAHWRALADYYPHAKVLHSVRDPDAWFDSTQATIFAPDSIPMKMLMSGEGPGGAFVNSFIGQLKGRLNDRAFMTDYFLRHTEAVKSAIPTDRLLIYEVGAGWAPLCAFLGAPVPDTPYPLVNSRTEFQVKVAAGAQDSFSAPAQ